MRAHRLYAIAAFSVLLPLTTGCWPIAPIAALAAAGGGGGGGGSAASLALSGTIVTDATSFGGLLALDREPNDTLGGAITLPAPDPGQSRRGDGTIGVELTLHSLVEQDGGARIVATDILAGSERSHAISGQATSSHLARRGNELLMVRSDGRGGAELLVMPQVDGLVKRRIALALPVVPAGAAACLDALLLLDSSGLDSRVVAFDADDGATLALHELGRGGLAHLAGAIDFVTGRERLFTCAPATGELFEIALDGDDGARRIGRLTPIATAGGAIDALAYDGAYLHVLRHDGTLESRDGALEFVAARPFSTTDRTVRSLVATLDLGLDHWHVEVPAGATLRVSVAAKASTHKSCELFLTARPRANVAVHEGQLETRITRFAADGTRIELELAALGGKTTGYDLGLGALAGRAHYQLALGGAARTPDTSAAVAGAADGSGDPAMSERVASLLASLPDAAIARLHDDPLLPSFMPGRLLVGRHAGAGALSLPPAPIGLSIATESRSASGFDRLRILTTAEWSGPTARTLNGSVSRRARQREESRALLAAMEALTDASGIAWREPDWIAHTLATTPDDPGYAANQTWHYQMLNLPAAWDLTTGDAATLLAVVDTGTRTENVDLAANVGGEGYDFISSTSNSGDGDGRDGNPHDEGSFGGNSHHGSHVGGTMGARGDNGTQGTGINWNCELMQLRALGTDGNGSISDISEAIRYAARLSNASGLKPTRRAAAINLSLGTSQPSNTIRSAIDAAIAAGCIVCAASGNDGNGTAVLYPAAYNEVIAIAAVDFFGGIAFYSNTGPEIDVACPGGSALGGFPARDVWSTVGVGGNGSLQPLAGTSMACAHATGVVGLLVTQHPALEQAEAEALLRSTAVDLGAPGFDDEFGYGLVDAAASVNDATAVLSLPTDELDFGTTGTTLLLQATNVGGGELTVSGTTLLSVQTPSGVPATTAWLTASLLQDGRTVQLAGDRTGLAAGAYQVQVDVDSNGGTDSMLVDLTAGSPTVTDVGDVVIQLFASDGTTLVKSITASFADGYAWDLRGVARGSYFVRCGVDLDNDGTLGEIGEPFGAYPNVGDEALLVYEGQPLQIDLLLD